MKSFLAAKYVILSFATLIVGWQLAFFLGDFNEALFPSPGRTAAAFWEICRDGSIFTHLGASMRRFVVGYACGVVIGTTCGLLMGWFSDVYKYVNPTVQLLRPISPTAWAPFIALWFGIGDVPAIVVVFIAAFFPMFLSTVAAVDAIEPIYLKAAQNFGIREPQILWKIVFPAALPRIATGARLALGSAWIFLVAGEMMGAQSGLGFLVIDARNNLRLDILAAAIATIGLTGLALDSAIKVVEKQLIKARGAK